MDTLNPKDGKRLAKLFIVSIDEISADDWDPVEIFPESVNTRINVATWAAWSDDAELAATGIFALTCNPNSEYLLEYCFRSPQGLACGYGKCYNPAASLVENGLRLTFAMCPISSAALMSKIIIDMLYYFGCLNYEHNLKDARSRASAEICRYRKPMGGYRIYSEIDLAQWAFANSTTLKQYYAGDVIIKALERRAARIAALGKKYPNRTSVLQAWEDLAAGGCADPAAPGSDISREWRIEQGLQ